MRRKTKLFSAFLAGMLLITAFGTTAFADSGNTTLTAQVPCTVTLSIGENGFVTVDGTKYTGDASFQKDLDTVVTYTISADSGYEIESVLYNGTDITSAAKSGSYTAAALTGNATLKVTFAKKAVPPSPPPANPAIPRTGDESPVMLWGMLLFVSGTALAVMLISRKRREN